MAQKSKNPSEEIGRLEQILASIREAVLVTDTKGIILVANPVSELITGQLPQKLIGQSIQKAITFTCTKADASWFLKEAVAGWRAVDLPKDCSVQLPNGDTLPVAATATPLYNPKGEYVGIVLLLRDLTEEAKLKLKQYKFISFVSHQLREPVGSLRWALEALLERKERFDPQDRDLLVDLYKMTAQFNSLITGLITTSKLEAGQVEFRITQVNIREVAQDITKELTGIATSQNVTVHLFVDTPKNTPLTIAADKDRLHDVFLNLLANAIRYNRPRGSVRIDAREVNASFIQKLVLKNRGVTGSGDSLSNILAEEKPRRMFLLITFADTGMGIPKNEQQKIFESFSRGSNVVLKGLRGTGLGLSIVKSVVERLGGSIFFTSKENVQTTFYLIFPIGPSDKKKNKTTAK